MAGRADDERVKTDWKEWEQYTKEKAEKEFAIPAQEGYVIKYTAPVRPRISKPKPRPLIMLPRKTITTKPELLPPYTTISIDPNEEFIDLDELKKYGRYAIISHDDRYQKKFLIADSIAPVKEIENPKFAEAVQLNREIEANNKKALDKYEASMDKYRAERDEYRKSNPGSKEGIMLPDDTKQAVEDDSYYSRLRYPERYSKSKTTADSRWPIKPRHLHASGAEGFNLGLSSEDKTSKAKAVDNFLNNDPYAKSKMILKAIKEQGQEAGQEAFEATYKKYVKLDD